MVQRLVIAFLLLAVNVLAQTPAPNPPTQHFVMSTTAGSFGGSAVAIASTGIQLIQQPSYAVSVNYEFISNPNDSSKPRIGSGLANVTKPACSFVPASLRAKLLIDLCSYNVTFQGGAGRESISNGPGADRSYFTVGNFAAYGSYPLPGGHTQVGIGYKWIVGHNGGLVHIPTGNLNFTF